MTSIKITATAHSPQPPKINLRPVSVLFFPFCLMYKSHECCSGYSDSHIAANQKRHISKSHVDRRSHDVKIGFWPRLPDV